MSDRALTLTVVLDKDYRVDNLESSLILAISQLRGVAEVIPTSVATVGDYMHYARVRNDVKDKIVNALNDIFDHKEKK